MSIMDWFFNRCPYWKRCDLYKAENPSCNEEFRNRYCGKSVELGEENKIDN